MRKGTPKAAAFPWQRALQAHSSALSIRSQVSVWQQRSSQDGAAGSERQTVKHQLMGEAGHGARPTSVGFEGQFASS